MTEKATTTLFADNVRYLMDRSGLSIRRLAAAVQLNPSSIARILSSGAVPRKKTIEAVAGYFHISPEAILNGSLREETAEALKQKGFFDKDYLASLPPPQRGHSDAATHLHSGSRYEQGRGILHPPRSRG